MATARPAQTIALANQKGGCGKTTTALSLAAALAKEGFATCIVDLDAQCNITGSFDVDLDKLHKEGKYTVLDVFLTKKPAREIELDFGDRFDGKLTLVPGHRSLDQVHSKMEADLQSLLIREEQSPLDVDDVRNEQRQRLAKSLESLRDTHDFIVIDTPPALGYLLTTALIAADWYLIPLFASFYDLDGLSKLTRTVKKVRERANPRLNLLGVVLGNYDNRTVLDSDIYTNLAQKFGDKMCKTVIHRSVKHRESTVFKQTIFEHAGGSPAAEQFLQLTRELLVRLGAAEEPATADAPAPPAPPTEIETGEPEPPSDKTPVMEAQGG